MEQAIERNSEKEVIQELELLGFKIDVIFKSDENHNDFKIQFPSGTIGHYRGQSKLFDFAKAQVKEIKSN